MTDTEVEKLMSKATPDDASSCSDAVHETAALCDAKADRKPKTILTCFAGRRESMTLLLRYVDNLIDANLVDEFHIWNFARNLDDDFWLRTLFGKEGLPTPVQPVQAGGIGAWNPSMMSAGVGPFARSWPTVPGSECTPQPVVCTEYKYVSMPGDETLSEDGQWYDLYICGKHDGHVKLTRADGLTMEVVIGGWNNTQTVVRAGEGSDACIVASSKAKTAVMSPGGWLRLRLSFPTGGSLLHVAFDDVYDGHALGHAAVMVAPVSVPAVKSSQWSIEVAGWAGDAVVFMHPLRAASFTAHRAAFKHLDKMVLMPVRSRKTWVEYYAYYGTPGRFAADDVIIKCDDDIVYVDCSQFAGFVEARRANTDPILLFPNIVNNEMCAWFQQQAGAIPRDTVGVMHGEVNGFGMLWRSGTVAGKLHDHFLADVPGFTREAANIPGGPIARLPLGVRISINFFAILGVDLVEAFGRSFQEDEMFLSQELPVMLQRNLAIYAPLVVAHLSFYKQVTTGLNMERVLYAYNALADKVLGPTTATAH